MIDSVTKFGEISPLWQYFPSLCQYFEGIFSIWQNYETTSLNFVCHWANFNCCKWTNIAKKSSHLVTLNWLGWLAKFGWGSFSVTNETRIRSGKKLRKIKGFTYAENLQKIWWKERLRLRLLSTEVYNRESIEGTKQSGTRFGEILPLWHQLKCLWQFYESLFSIWQKLLPTWVNFMYNWAIFHGSKWTNYENYKSHLVTLVLSNACFFIIGIV